MSKRNKNSQMTFQPSDILWLINEFYKQKKTDPSVNLDDFALRYGIMADELRLYTDEHNEKYQRCLTLWHGTTMTRAECIIEEGFKPGKGNRHRIFFTLNPKIARSYARGRASRESDTPAIIRCSIDLSEYDKHEWQNQEILSFNYNCIESNVVKRVTTIKSK